jgi:hypothetical protein
MRWAIRDVEHFDSPPCRLRLLVRSQQRPEERAPLRGRPVFTMGRRDGESRH